MNKNKSKTLTVCILAYSLAGCDNTGSTTSKALAAKPALKSTLKTNTNNYGIWANITERDSREFKSKIHFLVNNDTSKYNISLLGCDNQKLTPKFDDMIPGYHYGVTKTYNSIYEKDNITGVGIPDPADVGTNTIWFDGIDEGSISHSAYSNCVFKASSQDVGVPFYFLLSFDNVVENSYFPDGSFNNQPFIDAQMEHSIWWPLVNQSLPVGVATLTGLSATVKSYKAYDFNPNDVIAFQNRNLITLQASINERVDTILWNVNTISEKYLKYLANPNLHPLDALSSQQYLDDSIAALRAQQSVLDAETLAEIRQSIINYGKLVAFGTRRNEEWGGLTPKFVRDNVTGAIKVMKKTPVKASFTSDIYGKRTYGKTVFAEGQLVQEKKVLDISRAKLGEAEKRIIAGDTEYNLIDMAKRRGFSSVAEFMKSDNNLEKMVKTLYSNSDKIYEVEQENGTVVRVMHPLTDEGTLFRGRAQLYTDGYMERKTISEMAADASKVRALNTLRSIAYGVTSFAIVYAVTQYGITPVIQALTEPQGGFQHDATKVHISPVSNEFATSWNQTHEEQIQNNVNITVKDANTLHAQYTITPNTSKIDSQANLSIILSAERTPWIGDYNTDTAYLQSIGHDNMPMDAVLGMQFVTTSVPDDTIQFNQEQSLYRAYGLSPVDKFKQPKVFLQGDLSDTPLSQINIHSGEKLNLEVVVPKPDYLSNESSVLGGLNIALVSFEGAESDNLLLVRNDYDMELLDTGFNTDVLEAKFNCPPNTLVGSPCLLTLTMSGNVMPARFMAKLLISDMTSETLSIPLNVNYNLITDPSSFKVNEGNTRDQHTLKITNNSQYDYSKIIITGLPSTATTKTDDCINNMLKKGATCSITYSFSKVAEGDYKVIIKGVPDNVSGDMIGDAYISTLDIIVSMKI